MRDDDRLLQTWPASRKEKMMREKGRDSKKAIRSDGVKTKRKKKNQCSIFLLCLVSFSPCGSSPQGRPGKVEREWERANNSNESHPRKLRTRDE